MTAQPETYLSPEEYLALERRVEVKSEYLDGQMVAMAGASFAHNQIVANLVAELRRQLKDQPCSALPSDLRVWVPSSGSFFYPDVTVVCGEPAFHDDERDVLLNPQLIIEVLSPATEDFDRGRKFVQYRSIDSLREYLLVSQAEARVEQLVRQATGVDWLLHQVDGFDAAVELTSIPARLALAEIYDKVALGG